jgi:hypothetical protein
LIFLLLTIDILLLHIFYLYIYGTKNCNNNNNNNNNNKANFEHYICGVDRTGRPVEILVLKSPATIFAAMKEKGVSVDDLIDYMTFQHEYLWRKHFNDYDEVICEPFLFLLLVFFSSLFFFIFLYSVTNLQNVI